MRKLSTLFLALAASFSLLQPSFAQWGNQGSNANSQTKGALDQLLDAPAYAKDKLSARGVAPKRLLLSSIPFSQAGGSYNSNNTGQTTTFMYITPLEAANVSAVRIFFNNPWNVPFPIVRAVAYMSDSYGGLVFNGQLQPDNVARKIVMPTANSVLATCTSNGTTTLTCPGGTASFPSASTMYVLSPGNFPNSSYTTATIATGTTVTLSQAPTTRGSFVVQFANMATACQLYFDNAGARINTVNNSGTVVSATIVGPPQNTSTSTAYPTPFFYSDLAPCPSQGSPRIDGDPKPLLFITLAKSPAATGFNSISGTALSTRSAVAGRQAAAANVDGYNYLIAPNLGGRYVFMQQTWLGNTDATLDVTVGAGWGNANILPFIGIQYVTTNAGYNLVQTGDSISASSSRAQMDTILFQACKTISTPQTPCEYSNISWGGVGSSAYGEQLRYNMPAFEPSALVLQPITRNDGISLTGFTQVMSRIVGYSSRQDIKIGFLGAFPFTTSLDGAPASQSIVQQWDSMLKVMAAGCTPSTGGQSCPMYPYLDPIPVVSRKVLGGNFWNYLSTGLYATANAAAGATSISVQSGTVVGCYVGDELLNRTNPNVIAPGAKVTGVALNTLTVPNTAIVGAGISNLDDLMCRAPGYTGTYPLTWDNTHPGDGAIQALMPAAISFTKQLLGMQ